MLETRSGYEHGEAVQRYVGTSAIGTKLAKEEPTLILKGNMSSNSLDIG